MALLNPRYAASIENPRLWPPDDLNETPGSIVHARLLKIIDGFRGSLAANNSKTRAIRRSLIDAIDELTSATIKNSLAASVALQTAFVDAFPEQPDSSRSRLYKYSPVSSFASPRMVHLALQLSTKLRPLRVPVQFKVASEHQVLIEQFLLEIRNFKVAHHHDPLFVSKNRIREAELNKKEAELSKLLTPDEWASIDKDHLTSSLILQGELLLLPRINAGTSAVNLKQAASWLDRLGSAMQITFRINPSAPRGTHEEQSVAANQYTNSGVVFCVLALWLHYLSTNSSRRCEICYRNVKADAVHYCSHHYRLPGQEIPARQRHISTIYKQLVLKRLDSQRQAFGDLHLVGQPLLTVFEAAAKKHKVPKQLVPRAAKLASALHELRLYIGPTLESAAQRHFIQMLADGSAPFLGNAPGDLFMRRERRRLAIDELTLSSFFRTWNQQMKGLVYFESTAAKNSEAASTYVVPPRSLLAYDLFLQQCWTDVETNFDRFAYLSDGMLDLLKPLQTEQQPPPSLRALARQFGANRESVRQIFNQSKLETKGRKRIFKSGLQHLKNHLGL